MTLHLSQHHLLRVWLVTLCLLFTSASSPARSFAVDDSRSQVLGGVIPMQWEHFFPRAGQPDRLVGQISVRVHLDVSPWQGQVARIYHTLPHYPNGPFEVEWRSQGTLLHGQLRDGERTLIYHGRIDQPSLEDTLWINIWADGQRLSRAQPLAFSFEIELE
ncbi:MAG: hypothetical protein VXW65_07495 [Pseudomonadota bacterium]|nr:hypothetical protein [Pseudomonadota bacterium]